MTTNSNIPSPLPLSNDGIVCTVENDGGRRFNVRLVRRGDRYGLNDCLTHGKAPTRRHDTNTEIPEGIAAAGGYDGAMVEFYDATYANQKSFGPRGQFVSRYYLATLTNEDGITKRDRSSARNAGLCLDGGNAHVWTVSGPNVRDAIASAQRALGVSDLAIEVRA